MREASKIEYNDSFQKSFQKVNSTHITDLESVAKVLRSRAYRGDLMGENASAFGNIDIKLYSETSSAQMEFRALAGPLFYNTKNHKKNDININKTIIVDQDDVETQVNQDQLKEDDDESLVTDEPLSEIDIISDRRLVRDDIRAVALLKSNGPFKWSNAQLDVEHNGHPDIWNFEHVSPQWAWKHDTV